jgi:hypothetical protein
MKLRNSFERVAMQTLTILTICPVVLFLGSCGRPDERITAEENGPFKILVRSREFHKSGTQNIDICVAETSSTEFPNTRQCFLRGYDFDNLSVKWRGQRQIEVSFGCGRVTNFTSEALVYPKGPVPEEFHATLREECAYTGSTTCRGN